MPKKYEIFPYLASFLAEAHKDSSGGGPANNLKLSPMHTSSMVTVGHQVHRWAISANSGRNELGKKFY